MIVQMIEARLALAARRAALGTVGLIMLIVGLGFLTLAGWLALSAATDPLMAALIIGAAYTGVGLLVLLVASMRRYRVPSRGSTAAAAHASPNGDMLPAAIQAFIVGLTAGINSGSSRKH